MEDTTTVVTFADGTSATHIHVGGVQNLSGTPFIVILNKDKVPEAIALYNMGAVRSIHTPSLDRPEPVIETPVLHLASGVRLN